jgi:hypothetical protein
MISDDWLKEKPFSFELTVTIWALVRAIRDAPLGMGLY